MFNKKISLWQVIVLLGAIAMTVTLTACFDNQTSASNNNAQTAASKWGAAPNITNYYEYEQLKSIYELRDNPNLIMNAYIAANDGSLRCLGKVKGFGVPYGTEWSPPSSGTQGSVPEPNALYPSQSTSADWVQLIGKDGKAHVAFVEPNLIITSEDLPCKPLSS